MIVGKFQGEKEEAIVLDIEAVGITSTGQQEDGQSDQVDETYFEVQKEESKDSGTFETVF